MMLMSHDLIDIFGELNYPSIKDIDLDNLSLIDFARLLNWISLQLNCFAKTDSIVNLIKDESELDSLRIELNSLFGELGSIHSNTSIDNVVNRHMILYSLAGDLLAARVNYVKKFDENLNVFTDKLNPKNDIQVINNCLSIPKSSNQLKNIKTYFQTVRQRLDKSPLKYQDEDSLLLPNGGRLTTAQWTELKNLNEQLANEYALRREMLLRRADMTIGSFSWNREKTDDTDEKIITQIYQEKRKGWSSKPQVTLSHSLAARNSDCDSLINKRISVSHASCIIEAKQIGKANIGLQQRLQLHKFLIGAVPDRGGRPYEQPPPPKETFSHQQSQRDNRGGRGGAHRGGRSPNRRSRSPNRRYQQNYNNSNRYNDNYGGGRIQNAGWQQQHQGGGYYQDDDQRGGGGYHPRGGRGGYYRGGGGYHRGRGGGRY
ncbi:Protein fam98a [Dermatophagoides pteronyssinus]|uniref:Protein fam98a n=1 Tax=Dermatophagoides pteronyssinus TaxID=6956 RepID=A0ABQ8JTX0_DERPT|nr:Protein fam98a [Dermatophagoides pteronyssinus]